MNTNTCNVGVSENSKAPLLEIENSEGEKNVSFRNQGYEPLLANGFWYHSQKNRLLITFDVIKNEFEALLLGNASAEGNVLDLNDQDLASLFDSDPKTMMENVFHRVCGEGTPFKLFTTESGYEFHVSSRAKAIEVVRILIDILDADEMTQEYCYDEDDEESNDSDSLNAMSKILFFGGILVGIAFFLGRWLQWP